ncbi:MAG: hypothetical protein M3418_01345 [Gemmatimonadota bacterium]|nr:hypothetical protein [Gemmatimonadota bacterium]
MAMPRPAWAHVKWFSEFSYADRPLTLTEAVTPALALLALFSAAVIGALVPLDRRLARTPGYQEINRWLEARSQTSLTVLRIAAGAALLLAWQAGTLLVPEFRIGEGWLGWSQFFLVLLLLFPRTVPLAGAGLILLYVFGTARFGVFHMLDYLVYAGAGYALMVASARDVRLRGTAIPALYLTVGFSLCWVALEKIVYPQWGLYILEQHPQLALGFDLRFFLLGAAFVEFALGYLLIIGLLERPLALTITVVFFLTTMVFGKLEVIGHTLIHGALVVFLLEGPGKIYPAPFRLHSKMGLRTAFASVNFLLLFVVLFVPYAYGAWERHEARAVVTERGVRP